MRVLRKRNKCFGNDNRILTKFESIFFMDINFDKSTIIWITFSSYIFYTSKISRLSKINNYIINQMFKFHVFVFQIFLYRSIL